MCTEEVVLCKFYKPTIAIHYKGEIFILDQRWTEHLATVAVMLKKYSDISTLLEEMEKT